MSSFCGIKVHRGIGYIVTIGIIDGFRNQGLSSQLLTHMEWYLKKEYLCDIVLLNSSIENENSTFFYIHNNYEIIETLLGYYVCNLSFLFYLYLEMGFTISRCLLLEKVFIKFFLFRRFISSKLFAFLRI